MVSILIPVFNCRQWVAEAVRSALAQDCPRKEIIALDDCSTDGSWEVLKSFASEIRIARAETNGGQNASRNRLTAMSRGELLVYLDADDELLPHSLRRKMSVAPGNAAVFGSMEVAHFHGTQKTASERVVAKQFGDAWEAAFLWKYPNTSSFLFKRRALVAAGGWNEKIKNCTDYDLYFRLLLSGGTFKAVADAWSLYRQWSPAQAVNQAPLRKITTRLQVMTNAARQAKDMGLMTTQRLQAFLDASLGGIRPLYAYERPLALEAHKGLVKWSRDYSPSPTAFPKAYIMAYRVLGFRLAEHLATINRHFRKWRDECLHHPEALSQTAPQCGYSRI